MDINEEINAKKQLFKLIGVPEDSSWFIDTTITDFTMFLAWFKLGGSSYSDFGSMKENFATSCSVIIALQPTTVSNANIIAASIFQLGGTVAGRNFRTFHPNFNVVFNIKRNESIEKCMFYEFPHLNYIESDDSFDYKWHCFIAMNGRITKRRHRTKHCFQQFYDEVDDTSNMFMEVLEFIL